ncbi:SPDY domain-containing protein [Streptomyces sparsus]
MTVARMGPGFSTTAKTLKVRDWQLGPGEPTLVMDQFSAEDFHMVMDDRADVHVNSKDGRFYLGWSPLGRPGTDGEGWKIAVTGTATAPGYSISFGTETPADIVAAAVTRVLETARPR